MSEFFDQYFNVAKMIRDKREYRRQMARVKALPEDYRYLFEKIQGYMWKFAAGAGDDMMKLHAGLIDLFESGAADGKPVLELTGVDVAAFCDELLRSARTYPQDWRDAFNRDIQNKLGKKA